MERWADRLARVPIWIGRIGAWALMPLMLLIIIDVVTRRYLVLGSIRLQELEWHLHTIIFTSCLGFALVRNAHIRIDLIRDRLSVRKKIAIEIIGTMVFLLPFCLFLLYVSSRFALNSFYFNERSPSPGGLPYRWIIKAAIPVGVLGLLLAGVSILLKSIAALRDDALQSQARSDSMQSTRGE